MAEETKPHGWWQSIPGILTTIVGVITAVTSLLVALHQSGVFQRPDQSLNIPPMMQIVRDELLVKARKYNLGNPHTETPAPRQTPAPRNEGYWQRFERGYVYWSPSTDAHVVWGDIFRKWTELGCEQGFLGFPIADELSTPDGLGRYHLFQGGSIYWTPQTGAHEVHGGIREKWASMGWERSPLGYPVSDEISYGPRRISYFQNGIIIWTPEHGVEVKMIQ